MKASEYKNDKTDLLILPFGTANIMLYLFIVRQVFLEPGKIFVDNF